MTAPHWEHQDHAPRDDSGDIAQYDPDASCPFKVASHRELTLGKPLLTDEAMGWLAYSHRRATVFGGKWTKDDVIHASFDNYTGVPVNNYYKYDLTFSTYVLALMAEHTPAWREVYTTILDFTASKFLEYWTFFDWVERKGADPNRDKYPEEWWGVLMPKELKGKYDSPAWVGNGTAPWPYDPDPVRANGHCNAMYKGYLGFVTGLYQYVSGDDKYDHPFKIVYDDSLVFEYDTNALAQLIADQFYDTVSGISCEVTKSFGWCNNITGMGLALHDMMHGTTHTTAYYNFLGWFRKNYMVGGEGSGPIESYALYHDMTNKVTLLEEGNQFAHNFMGTSWNGCALDEDLHRRLYDGGMNRFFTVQEDGSAWMEGMPGLGADMHYATSTAFSISREWGDMERHAKLRAWIRKEYEPTWDMERGEFYHLCKLGDRWPRGQFNNWLMPGYTMTEAGEWRRLFRSPQLDKFRQPTVEGVDFPTVRPRQAYWDATERALFVSITSCDQAKLGEATSFRVTNLLPGAKYRLTIDGQHKPDLVEAPSGTTTIDTTVGAHAIILQQVTG